MIRFAIALFASLTAFGGTVYTFDTSSLVGNPNAPFTLDFNFNDGSGAGDGNNTVTLSSFVLGAGSLTQSSISGGVTVNASPFSVTLTDNSFFNDVQFTFVPDTSLSFQIDYTANPDDGTPDTFTVAILDRNLINVPTTNPNNGIAFIELDLPTANPTAGTQLILSGSTQNSDGVNIPPPTSGAVPEPSTSIFFGIGLTVVAAKYSVRRWA
jgi:hypothetical protein